MPNKVRKELRDKVLNKMIEARKDMLSLYQYEGDLYTREKESFLLLCKAIDKLEG